VALADVYDALTTRRVYKPAFTHETARATILDGRGIHFDPQAVAAFLACEDQFVTIKEQLAEDVPANSLAEKMELSR
jgi:response regulator RpfG family c-di-GMP phosphodiesterase